MWARLPSTKTCLRKAARHFQPGDKIIVIADAYIEPSELKDLNPVVIFVDDKNRIKKIKKHKVLHAAIQAETKKLRKVSHHG